MFLFDLPENLWFSDVFRGIKRELWEKMVLMTNMNLEIVNRTLPFIKNLERESLVPKKNHLVQL